MQGQKNIFLNNFFLSSKFCGIKSRYTKFQGNLTKNSHFVAFKVFKRTLNWDNFSILSNIMSIFIAFFGISLKSLKINIFCSNKNQYSLFMPGNTFFSKEMPYLPNLTIFFTKKPKMYVFSIF